MPLMIKLNRNIMKVYLSLDNGHFITVELENKVKSHSSYKKVWYNDEDKEIQI